MQLDRSSVRIELVKLRVYAEKNASVCNWALVGAGKSFDGAASVCNVVRFMSAKSDGGLLE